MVQATRPELTVARREVVGKKVRALRREGVTPANIFGHHVESMAVQMPTDDLRQLIKVAGRNDIVYLLLDGEDPRPTFIKGVQRDPVSDQILHVDFLQISLEETVRLEVPLHLVGVPPAVDSYGGILMQGVDRVTVEALPISIPSSFEIDVSVLEEIDQSLHVSDLTVPDGVTVLTDPEVVIAKISPPAVERVDEEAAELAEGEEPAEGEEAAAEEGGEEAGDSEAAEE